MSIRTIPITTSKRTKPGSLSVTYGNEQVTLSPTMDDHTFQANRRRMDDILTRMAADHASADSKKL